MKLLALPNKRLCHSCELEIKTIIEVNDQSLDKKYYRRIFFFIIKNIFSQIGKRVVEANLLVMGDWKGTVNYKEGNILKTF